MEGELGVSVAVYAVLCVGVPLLWGLMVAWVLGRRHKTPARPRKERRTGEYDI